MTFPTFFRFKRSQGINVDWSDVTYNIGYIDFVVIDPTTGTNALIRSTDYTALNFDALTVELNGTTTAGTFTKVIDVDYDGAVLLSSMIIEGNMLGKVSLFNNGTATGGKFAEMYIKLVLKEWDGSTETTIHTWTGPTSSKDGANTEEQTNFLNEAVTRYVIPKGSQLRLTVEGWARQGDGDTADMDIGVNAEDDAGGSFSAKRSALLLSLPIKVDVE